MNCPHCDSCSTRQRKQTTQLGYEQYICSDCNRQFNERTGTSLNFIEHRTEVLMMVVYHYIRFKLSLDDVVELMAMRGFTLSHQTVHNWTQTFGTELGIKLRKKRKGKADKKWHIDATYIKVEGRWCYLYRAIDKAGNLVDIMLSDVRDQAAAERFLRQCQKTTGTTPIQITTDKETALYPAIANIFPDSIHRDVKYKNNIIESDHCGTKSRYRVMKGFKNPFSAVVFCTAFEEVRELFSTKKVKRSQRCSTNVSKIQELNKIFQMA